MAKFKTSEKEINFNIIMQAGYKLRIRNSFKIPYKCTTMQKQNENTF